MDATVVNIWTMLDCNLFLSQDFHYRKSYLGLEFSHRENLHL